MRLPLLMAAGAACLAIGGDVAWAVLAGVVLVLGYLLSLQLHPHGRICRRCHGQGFQRGGVFTYSTRPCTRCGGNQVRGRYGVRILYRNSPTWAEDQAAAARRPHRPAAQRPRCRARRSRAAAA